MAKIVDGLEIASRAIATQEFTGTTDPQETAFTIFATRKKGQTFVRRTQFEGVRWAFILTNAPNGCR